MEGGGIFGFNPGGLFGETDAQYQAKLASQKANQYGGQAATQYQNLANTSQNLVNQSLSGLPTQENAYQNIINQLAGNVSGSQQAFNNILQQFGAATGVNTANINPFAASTSTLGQVTNPFTTAAGRLGIEGGSLAGRNIPGVNMNLPAGVTTRAAGLPSLVRPVGTATPATPGQTGQAGTPAAGGPTASNVFDRGRPSAGNQATTANGQTGATGPTANSPYQLNQYQQEQLNQQMNAVLQDQQQALAQYRAQMGNAPNPAGEAVINQYYTQQAQNVRANFEENARQQVAASAQNLLSMFGNMAQTNQAAEMGGVENFLNFLNNQLQTGLTGQGNAAAGLGSLGGAQTQLANMYQQQQQQSSADFLKLLAYGLSGGFSNPKAATPAGTTPTLSDYIPGGGGIA